MLFVCACTLRVHSSSLSLLSSVTITWIYKARSGLGNDPSVFFRAAALDQHWIFSIIFSLVRCISMPFSHVHALIHWHDSQRYTAVSCSSPKSYALTVTVVAAQRMMWGLETVLHKNLHILAYLLYSQLNYLSVSLHWYWKILSISISSWCSC